MSEALKSNTTLTELILGCKDKRKKTHTRYPSAIHSAFLVTSIGNHIGDTGATSLSESLKSNTTLTKLNLGREDKRRHTKDIHNGSLFLSLGMNRNKIGDTGAKSLSEALKSNTTLTKLNLYSENKRKKTHARHPSTNHSFPCTEA